VTQEDLNNAAQALIVGFDVKREAIKDALANLARSQLMGGVTAALDEAKDPFLNLKRYLGKDGFKNIKSSAESYCRANFSNWKEVVANLVVPVAVFAIEQAFEFIPVIEVGSICSAIVDAAAGKITEEFKTLGFQTADKQVLLDKNNDQPLPDDQDATEAVQKVRKQYMLIGSYLKTLPARSKMELEDALAYSGDVAKLTVAARKLNSEIVKVLNFTVAMQLRLARIQESVEKYNKSLQTEMPIVVKKLVNAAYLRGRDQAVKEVFASKEPLGIATRPAFRKPGSNATADEWLGALVAHAAHRGYFCSTLDFHRPTKPLPAPPLPGAKPAATFTPVAARPSVVKPAVPSYPLPPLPGAKPPR
jgi:hypothetical protein